MNLKKAFAGMMAAVVCFGASAMAQEAVAEKSEWIPNVDLNVKYANNYLSKGKIANPKSMLFTDATLELKGFYGGIWAANDLNDYNKDGIHGNHQGGVAYEPEEIDYYIGYGYTFEELPVVNSLSLDFCFTYWDYPERLDWNHPGEQKVEYALSANLGVFLEPGIKICWDPENEKWYGNLNCGWSYNFKEEGAEPLTFNTGLELWMGNHRFFGNYNDGKRDIHNGSDWTFTTLCWTSSLDYAITENITISPFLQLAQALDHDYRASWKPTDDAKNGMNLQWGANLNFNF